MNVVFMGTPEFAVPSLRSLATSTHKLIAAVTQPDRPKGRSKVPCPSPVKEAARELGLEIMQPVNINEAAFVKQLQLLSPDCIVVVAFGQFLSIPIINLPGYRCVNIHASLLPKLRGAAPINWAIIRGERITGVTSVVMTAKMDAGDIIAQKTTPIFPGENVRELEERLASMGATLLIDTLKSIETGNATYTKQDEKEVTFAPKLKKENGLIPWSQETQKIHNLIRGVTPSPGAYTYYCTKDTEEKKRLIILKTQIHETSKTKTSLNPGTVVEIAPCGIHVATLDGFLCITRLQPEGKRAMDAQGYTRGYKMITHDVFLS
ncbi:MAG: methionyl-tRNA formyltransferase [Candidatus Brocadiaceae bacterium]|uniref:methionyl-tRNA formyltransferase n=1 Tax=Candidatus Wunengus sp. YC61 TaxID=3367698 RepID=UPI0027216CE1|nr:methionyl-tRNA formyltransferase [Candidatus Brocadiaceae bacterium]